MNDITEKCPYCFIKMTKDHFGHHMKKHHPEYFDNTTPLSGEGLEDYQVIINDYFITVDEAKEVLGFASRNSIERLLKKGEIRFIWICKGKPSAVRLLYKMDVIAQSPVSTEN